MTLATLVYTLEIEVDGNGDGVVVVLIALAGESGGEGAHVFDVFFVRSCCYCFQRR